MERFVKGEIIVINFPFSNLEETKRRPALILKNIQGNDLLLCQITSKDRLFSIPISEKDFEKGKLNRTSFVRIDKLFTIEKNRVIYSLGKLHKEKFKLIQKELIDFILN